MVQATPRQVQYPAVAVIAHGSIKLSLSVPAQNSLETSIKSFDSTIMPVYRARRDDRRI